MSLNRHTQVVYSRRAMCAMFAHLLKITKRTVIIFVQYEFCVVGRQGPQSIQICKESS